MVLFAAITVSRDGWSVLSVTGDCDLATGPEHFAEIVHGLDAVGLGLLVGAARRVDELVVVAPVGSSPRRALETSRLDEILDVRDQL